MITEDYVRSIFKGLENGDGASFFEHVADDVDWTVMCTHPLADPYKSKADFIAGTFAKLGKVDGPTSSATRCLRQVSAGAPG